MAQQQMQKQQRERGGSGTGSHTVVVGGGIVGLSAAWYLARRGERVTVLEQGKVGEGASGGNAGIIALGHVPLPRPGVAKHLVKAFVRRTNPLYIAPRFDRDLFDWLKEFRRACSQRQLDQSMAVLAELGWLAGDAFDEIIEAENIDAEYHRTGWLDVFKTEAGFEEGRRTAELTRSHGFGYEELSGDALREREPAFLDDVAGAIHYTDSRFAHPRKFVEGLAKVLRGMGVTILEERGAYHFRIRNKRVNAVHLDNNERLQCDHVVLAAGAWTTALAQKLGVRIPMEPGKGYHLEIDCPSLCVSTTCVLAERFVAVTPIGGRLRLAGTLEFSGMNHGIMPKRVDALRRGASAYLRDVAEQEERVRWCGLRPCTADGLPIIGRAPQVPNVYVGTGHAMMGFALGPATGKILSELVLDGESELMDLEPMSVDRFQSNMPKLAGVPHVGARSIHPTKR